MKKSLIASFVVVVGILTAGVVSYAVSGAWTEPSQSPPNGNVSGLSSILQGGDLVISGAVKANDFLVTYTDAENKSVSKSLTLYVDKDGDGMTPAQGDCDDTNAAIHPGAAPQYDSGKDYDCSGTEEYTVDVNSDVNVWQVNNACTDGGSFTNFQGYIKGYKCLSASVGSCGAGTTSNSCQQCTKFDSNITNIVTMLNQKSKYLLCLNSNYGVSSVMIGTSGDAGSCGGTSEQRVIKSKVNILNAGLIPSSYDRAISGSWHVWCN